MAATAALIADTISGMKHALDRDAQDYRFESEPSVLTNRGNKLKRTAVQAHEGTLGGQRPYKKRAEHASYHRNILHRRQPRYDEYGYLLDDEDVDEDADEEVAVRDPYRDIHIERLLMPLVAAADLEYHDTLSTSFQSTVLPDMVAQARTTLHKERRELVALKRLLTDFRGDRAWGPAGRFADIDGMDLFAIDSQSQKIISAAPPDSNATNGTRHPSVSAKRGIKSDGADSATTNGDHTEDAKVEPNETQDNDGEASEKKADSVVAKVSAETVPAKAVNGTSSPKEQDNNADGDVDGEASGGGTRSPSPAFRMVTRGQAQAQASSSQDAGRPNSGGSKASAGEPSSILPLFVPPADTTPDRDQGLPAAEAEEMRRMLTALVQKQEEAVRGTEQMYHGLLRAHRLARTVWHWCRAEGHVGEMSDGEDWVDAEEWDLDGPLKKGQEEVDDTTEKKTRGRRAPP